MWLATEVETLAKMYVHALAIGEPPRLSDKEMTQVQEQIKRMSYGQAPDLDTVKDSPKVKGAIVTVAKKAAPAKAAAVTVAVKGAAPKAAAKTAATATGAKRPGRPAKAAKAPVMTATALEKPARVAKPQSEDYSCESSEVCCCSRLKGSLKSGIKGGFRHEARCWRPFQSGQVSLREGSGCD